MPAAVGGVRSERPIGLETIAFRSVLRRGGGRRRRDLRRLATRPCLHDRSRPRAERPARDHRHTAGRRPVGLRWSGADSQPRPARLARRAFHVRPRSHRSDASVPHLHPVGTVSLSARHPGQQRVPRQAGHADHRDATQAARVRDRRFRRRISPDETLRVDARLRPLRRPDAGNARGDRDLDARAAGGSRRLAGGGLDRQAEGQVLRLGARLRPALALSPATGLSRSLRAAAVLRRGGVRRCRARAAVRPTGITVTADPGHRHRRPRREPRRARRADARHVRLRTNSARAADHRARDAKRDGRDGRRHRRTGTSRGSRPDRARRGGRR